MREIMVQEQLKTKNMNREASKQEKDKVFVPALTGMFESMETAILNTKYLFHNDFFDNYGVTFLVLLRNENLGMAKIVCMVSACFFAPISNTVTSS